MAFSLNNPVSCGTVPVAFICIFLERGECISLPKLMSKPDVSSLFMFVLVMGCFSMFCVLMNFIVLLSYLVPACSTVLSSWPSSASACTMPRVAALLA